MARVPHAARVTPLAKRQAIAILYDEHGAMHWFSLRRGPRPECRACEAVRLSRAAYYRPIDEHAQLRQDQALIDALQAKVSENTRWGFWKRFDALRLEGARWNHKRVRRVYCALHLDIPRRTRRRVRRRILRPLVAPPALKMSWARSTS